MTPTILLLSAASFIVVAVMTVTGPLLPLVAAEFDVSVGSAGYVVTAFAVPYGAFQVVFGPLGDRYGKLRVIATALGVSTVFTWGCAWVVSLEGLAAMRALGGLVMAGTVPLAMAWIADEVPYARRQPVIGRYINGLVLGQIAGGSLGGLFAEYFDWRLIFEVFAVVSALLAAVLWARARRDPLPPRGHATLHPGAVFTTYGRLLRQRRPRDLVIIGTLEGALVFGVLTYFGAYLRHAFALDYATIGLTVGCFGLGGLVYSALVYRLVPLLGERRMIGAGTALLGLAYLVLPWLPRWYALVPLFVLGGFGFYMFHNTLQTQATEMASEARGTALSLWVFMLFAGQGVGVVAFGAVVDAVGYVAAFSGGGLGLLLLGWWCQRCMARWHRPAA